MQAALIPHSACLRPAHTRALQLPLSDIFKLDVRGMKSVDDYCKVLSKKGRWNFKDRQKKCAARCARGCFEAAVFSSSAGVSMGLTAPLPPPPPHTHLCCRFAAGLSCEYVPLKVGDRAMVDMLWPLYQRRVAGVDAAA